MSVDLNELAKRITLEEGKKESVNIAQVKEVLRIALQELAKLSEDELMDLLSKY